jgi:hypothetical protein
LANSSGGSLKDLLQIDEVEGFKFLDVEELDFSWELVHLEL